MHDRTIDGITIRYESLGDGQPMVMLHGWGADHRVSMRMLEPVFNTRPGWRRIYPDLPGMGTSPADPRIRSHDDMLEVIGRFVDSFRKGKRAVIGGVSYGGYLAQGLVHTMGQRLDGLLLVVPSVERMRSRQRYPEHCVLVEEVQFADSLTADEGWLVDSIVVQTERVLDQVRDELLPALSLADVGFLQSLGRESAFAFDVTSLAQPFAAPALVLAGRQDSVTGFREAMALLEQYPRGTFAVLDTAGHMLHREQTAVYRTLVSEWVDRVERFQAVTARRSTPSRRGASHRNKRLA